MDPNRVVHYFGLREGMKVADFGSGAGHFAILMAKIVGETGTITAIDVMQSSLEALLGQAKAGNIQNIVTHRGDLEVPGGSGLAEASQDAVLLANVLFQSDKKTDILLEAGRILKSGGSIIIINWQKGAGGLGPPDDMRSTIEEIKTHGTGAGLQYAQSFDVGAYHFGLILRKS